MDQPKKKIWVADDDDAILDTLSIILEAEGYDVEPQPDGFQLMKEHSDWPDLILLDNKLSGIEGTQICQHLKANPATKDIPVIMLSAAHDIKEKMRIAGADDFVPKPFTTKMLLERIELLLQKKTEN